MSTPRYHAALSVLVTLLLGASTATAQDQHTVHITDGEVYVDGRRIPAEELPESLRFDGSTISYTFSGDVRPVVQIGGEYFVIENGGLRAADPSEQAAFSFPRPPRVTDFEPPSVRVEFSAGDMRPPLPPHAAEIGRRAELLHRQAQELQEVQRSLQQRFGRQQAEILGRLATEASFHAAEAARMATALPQMEVEWYLDDVRRQNRRLFDRLVDERQLEQRTIEMARQVRTAADEAERQERIDELRARLGESFELKQENRRNEVERLESRLGELRQRLAERERLRDDIIDRRLRELIGDDVE